MTGIDIPTDVFDGVELETLLGTDLDVVEAVFADDRSAPLAVVGPPYAGRGRVLDAVADRLGGTRVHLDPGDGAAVAVDALGEGPAVVGNCQHLYERRVGGFDPLSSFLDAVADAPGPVVTGWNASAWAYLSAVRTVDRTIPATAEVGPVDAETMASVLPTAFPEVTYRRDDPEAVRPFVIERRTVSWRGRELSLPVARLDPGALARVGSDEDRSPSEAVFDRLAARSGGNLGVAAALLAACDGPVAPADLEPPGADATFDGTEAFCLRLLLGAEHLRRETLAQVLGEQARRLLGQFDRQGLVAATPDGVRLRPLAVPTVAAAVERAGIL